MKKFFKVLLVMVVISSVVVGTAFALVYVNRSPNAMHPSAPELNDPNFWGDECEKLEDGFEGDVYFLSSSKRILIIKSGVWNFVWSNPTAGFYGTPLLQGNQEPQDVSHVIVCELEETPTPTPTTPVTPTDTPTFTPTPTGTPTETPTPTPTGTPTETPTPTPTGTPCVDIVYVLKGLRYDCYLNINPNTDDPSVLPLRYDGTDYMYDLCATVYTCTGSYLSTFEWTGEWEALCKVPCLDCE